MVEETTTSAAMAPTTRRFAPNAPTYHGQEATGATQPSYVFLRVKRKRHEDPVECLLVQSEPELKRHRDSLVGAAPASPSMQTEQSSTTEGKPAQSSDLLAAFTKLSTKERGFVFKRIETLESHQLSAEKDSKWAEKLKRKVKSIKATERVNAKKATAEKSSQAMHPNRQQQQQARNKQRRQSEVLKSRGLTPLEMKEHHTSEVSGVHVVDLAAVTSEMEDVSAALSAVTVNGATMRSKRVLNPHERELDEAIWMAFQHNDFSHFFRIFYNQRPELRLDPSAFQRPADGGTILMAAGMHGRADVIEAVLRSSTASVLQQDWAGATASSFARQHGHTNVETALMACEEAEREKEYVYDVYCIDMAASAQRGESPTEDKEIASAPIVSVSSAVQRWLTQEAGASSNPGDDDEDVDQLMLDSEAESNADDDNESIDSNDENYAFNDYPDEESDGSDYDSDDSDAAFRRLATSYEPSKDDRTSADY
ncbi:hypothetical protein Poli38472_005750 [Pythium oligandrum]|uniref:Probable RNA polymerase II nuclear localization protein SLC7A6OS n=1 Tax=Pythium oligandrum TaxID=41045 RepID=A0A8K1FQT2_PYTOL|nr:hypothetical protein Poli38472_005750 [Pythium oligandrum]|eukprot:TMW68282.1 hypothetical protein Poli38472_005750 [Pythium oligandrum]